MRKKTKDPRVNVKLLALVIVISIVAVAWFAWHRNSGSGSHSATSAGQTVATGPTTYTFRPLGISMDILPGWKVISSPSVKDGANFYHWSVRKRSAGGTIEVDSSGFETGNTFCAPTTADIVDTAPTRNKDLMFMYWKYASGASASNQIVVLRTHEEDFGTWITDEAVNDPVDNDDIKPGDYYFCFGQPLPGFSLHLNEEAAGDSSRQDSIHANLSGQDPTTRPVYSQIKTMLTSIQ